MKKQVFGLIAALFVCAVLLPVGARAANDVYAILYEDGTLVFQNGNTPEPGRAVAETYPVDLTGRYTFDYDTLQPNTPWYNERESIRVVSFADRVSPTSTAHWFYDCHNLECIENIQNLDTANVIDMSCMFSNCYGLSVLDVSHFDTVKVTDMNCMFSGCSELTALDVSHFDTTNVTDMSYMFSYCSGLTALDVSHFDTANVTDMSYMFEWCSGLTALDISHFDTANVTNMTSMFHACGRLTALDVSHFDTANVTEMVAMFHGCRGLTSLDISNFNTAKVTSMGLMFSACSGLKTLDMSHFDTDNVISMYYMFRGCSGLTMLDLSNFDTANVTSMSYIFDGCLNLKTIHVSDKFTTASLEGNSEAFSGSMCMFLDCTSLVGGNGTTYDESHIEAEYARIDTASTPGYFTYKATPVAYAITAAVPRNRTLSVTLSNPAAATVAVACFDTNGRFLSVNLQDAPANVGAVTVSVPTNAKRALVMLWNNARRPLCAAFAADIR